MIRILFGLMVVTGVLLIPLFATESRAQDQKQIQVAAKSTEELQIESLKQEIEAIQNQDQKQI
jgi:hypothetical protein